MYYEVGDKFEIEIGEILQDEHDNSVYRIKGFRTLVFDEYGLSKLKRIYKSFANDEEFTSFVRTREEIGYNLCLTNCEIESDPIGFSTTYKLGYDDGKAYMDAECIRAREAGAEMMWNAMQRLLDMWLLSDSNVKDKLLEIGLTDSKDGDSIVDVMRTANPDKFIEKIEKMEDYLKEHICVGDEVEGSGEKWVVTKVIHNENPVLFGIDMTGRIHSANADNVKKTGRRSDEFALLLERGIIC